MGWGGARKANRHLARMDCFRLSGAFNHRQKFWGNIKLKVLKAAVDLLEVHGGFFLALVLNFLKLSKKINKIGLGGQTIHSRKNGGYSLRGNSDTARRFLNNSLGF
jgi:hypothetical protein